MWVPVLPRDFLVADVGPFCLSLENYCSLTTPLKKTEAINKQKQRQQYYYDRHVKKQKPIAAGEAIRMRLPGQKTWSRGVCAGLVGPRSYRVKVGESTFVRNRRQLIRSDEIPVPSPSDDDIPYPQNDSSDKATLIQSPPGNQPAPNTDMTGSASSSVDSQCPEPRRSTRNRKPPDYYMPS